MVTRLDVIREARALIGTPFRHAQRVPGEGVDCIGCIVLPGQAAGLPVVDRTDYGPRPNPRQLLRHIPPSFERIEIGTEQPGDVLLFWFLGPKIPQHAGLVVDRPQAPRGLGLLHAYQDIGRVQEVDLDGYWLERVHSAWAYRGLEE